MECRKLKIKRERGKGEKREEGQKVAATAAAHTIAFDFKITWLFGTNHVSHSDSKNDAHTHTLSLFTMYAMLCYAMQMGCHANQNTHTHIQASDLIKLSVLCYSNDVLKVIDSSYSSSIIMASHTIKRIANLSFTTQNVTATMIST